MKKLCTAALLVGLLLLASTSALAYGKATLAEKYPQTVAADTFASLANAQVEQLLTDAKETRRHTVELVKAPKPMRAPAGNITYDVSAPTGLHYSSMTPIYVSVVVDGVPYRQVICYFRIHVYENLMVAARNLFPDRELTSADVRQEEREVTSTMDKYLTKAEDVQGHVVNQMVREGTAFTQRMLRNPVVIQAGTTVSIMANVNGIVIRTEGVALQRGRADEFIRVRNVNSRKVLRVRVIDAANVEVVQ